MNNIYPYRFKTKEEFDKSNDCCFDSNRELYYDSFWNYEWVANMNYLFGKPYPYYITKNSKLYDYDNWKIEWFMLTENIKIPNYKPKKLFYE
jgi:hypothetical protein